MEINKIVILVFIVLVVAGCSQKTSTKQLEKNNSSNEIIFYEGMAIISSEDKICDTDNDCILFQPDCEDCKYYTLNKDTLARYKKAKYDYCQKNIPKTMCDAMFTGELKCINKSCIISIRQKEEESDINCTSAGQSADEYSFGIYIGPKRCCRGLEKIPVKDYRNGECYELFDVGTVCSECGNDICEEWENPCNCPKDCK